MAKTIPNVTNLFITLYPLFIIGFVSTAAIFNNDFGKAGIYLLWVLGLYGICGLVGWAFARSGFDALLPRRAGRVACNVFYSLGDLNTVIPTKVAISFFTLLYLTGPALVSGRIQYMAGPTIYLSIFALAYSVLLFRQDCATPPRIITAFLIGTIVAVFAVAIMNATRPDLLFYNELVSNNAVCKLDTSKQFRCVKGGSGLWTMYGQEDKPP
jgi:hypothetical protein